MKNSVKRKKDREKAYRGRNGDGCIELSLTHSEEKGWRNGEVGQNGKAGQPQRAT